MKFKDFCIQEIKRMIKETFTFSNDYNVDVYGSYATGLMIEASDIDIKIKLNSGNKSDLNNYFEALCKKLENENKFDKITPIGTASVPVIKLLLSSEKFIKGKDELENNYKQFKELSLFKHYLFDINELTKIKVDVTFILEGINKNNSNNNNEINENNIDNKNNSNNNNEIMNLHDKPVGNEMSSVAYVKEQIIKYPEIKFILRVLKRYFYYKKMNTSFLGGLSSYNLFLLLLSYAKLLRIPQRAGNEIIENNDNKNNVNLGYFLFNFLDFFNIFNFKQCVIDINSPNIYNLYDIGIPKEAKEFNFGKSIVIIDPLTGVNASKSSYKIDEIHDTFAEAFAFLNNEKLKYDKEGKTKVSKNNNKDILMGLPISNKNDNNHGAGGGNIIEKFLGK
jgi:DNA polymerase sigma